MKKIRLIFLIFLVPVLLYPSLQKKTEEKAHISEELRVFKTYSFFDPDLRPNIGRIYPYFKFSGYSHKGINKKWKIIQMENPYIKVFISPEIGGKIWGAVEKSTNKAFIYFNKVVKFRNIAMRGPWTSGGIEFNFGAIGHAPSCATPVDYIINKEKDGSVNCTIGGLDLPSRTEWRVKISLPKDKAFFETECFWSNPTSLNTSLYHWMTAAADARPDLHFYFPGSHYIGHDGNSHPWPVNNVNRDLSLYKNNDFGPSKSYHILGEPTEYFAGYWKDLDFGFGHWSLYDEKPGKKLWIWSLSRSGEIWKDLLTDPGSNQYIEMQTGLLFNQAALSSTKSPFKHLSFAPLDTHHWKEIWFPIKDIKGVVKSSPAGTLNVTRNQNSLTLALSPIDKIDDILQISVSEKQVFSKKLNLNPMETYSQTIPIPENGNINIDLGDGKLFYSSLTKNQILERPLLPNKNFDWNSSQGLFITANELAKQRYYNEALLKYLDCLQKEPSYLPALVGIAELYFKRAEYETALKYAKIALSVDTYHPEANFIYGTIQHRLGKTIDAKDGYGWAARSVSLRSAANSRLSSIELKENHIKKARNYALRSLEFNSRNLESHKILALAARLEEEKEEAKKRLHLIEKIDPLNHFIRFERYFLQKNTQNLHHIKSLIRNEFPHETYLELALWYFNHGLYQESEIILKEAPTHPIIQIWLAYLAGKNDKKTASFLLKKALENSPNFVFPFRLETIPVLQWASGLSDHWKIKYYLGLLLWSKGHPEKAFYLMKECRDKPDFSVFYLSRAELAMLLGDKKNSLQDIKQAIQTDLLSWRAWHMQTAFFLQENNPEAALESAKKIFSQYPENSILAMDYAKTLLQNNQFRDCLSLLKNAKILPSEGARQGHDLYRQAALLSSLNFLKKGNVKKALELVQTARQWPENLGVGKPYDTDERLEDFIAAHCYKEMGENKKEMTLYKNIMKTTSQFRNQWKSSNLISAIVYKNMGMIEKAEKLFSDWRDLNPDNRQVMEWALSLFNDNHADSLMFFDQGISRKKKNLWNAVKGDNDFPVIAQWIQFFLQDRIPNK